MEDNFYLRFEEKFRGSREDIKGRLKIYFPIIDPIRQIYPDALAIDIGCGRGEWIDLLQEKGWETLGVDINQAMIDYCKKNNLNVIKADALNYLKTCESESVALITGFHIIEHLRFQDQHELVKESLRVLQPGGLLILETPNPENIKVATEDFYLDPTHLHPVPAKLLSFLVQDAGFYRNTIFRLQETKDLLNNPKIELMDVLTGSSQDYSVITQKTGSADVCSIFDQEFEKVHGIGRKFLANKYDQQIEESQKLILSEMNDIGDDLSKIQTIASLYDLFKENLNKPVTELQGMRGDLQLMRTMCEEFKNELAENKGIINSLRSENQILICERNNLTETNNKFRSWCNDLEVKLAENQSERNRLEDELNKSNAERQAIQVELDQVYNSRSFRIAKPMRDIFFIGRKIKSKLGNAEYFNRSKSLRGLEPRMSGFQNENEMKLNKSDKSLVLDSDNQNKTLDEIMEKIRKHILENKNKS